MTREPLPASLPAHLPLCVCVCVCVCVVEINFAHSYLLVD